jgi:hypothetical protein
MQTTPQSDAAFQGAAHVGVDLRVTAAQFLENRDGAKAGRFDKNWYDFSLQTASSGRAGALCAAGFSVTAAAGRSRSGRRWRY